MEINIRVTLIINDNKTLLEGPFKVNTYPFLENPHQEAARVSYEWIKKINKETGHTAKILNVTYNNEHDITELVKKIEKAPSG